jgi:ferredoxin
MEVKVDWDLCESNGVCAGLAPEVFELDDEENLHVANPIPADSEARVRSAIDRCPKNALSL